MSDDEREHWDRRYAEGDYTPRTWPTPFLVEWLDRIPTGRALEVAAGTGRNALHLAEAGFDVTAIDISEVAVTRGKAEAERRGLELRWEIVDLDTDPLPGDAYDLITVLRYRNADLWPRLVEALAPGGWIVVEHHMQTHLDVAGPSTDAFRLEPGELLRAFGDLRVVHYSERVEAADDEEAMFAIARVVACNGDPGW